MVHKTLALIPMILAFMMLLVPSGASPTVHTWSQVAVFSFTAIGGPTQTFNSTLKGSTGVGVNFTMPAILWNLPFTTPQVNYTNILLWITGWVVIHIGSFNSTDSVIFTVGPVVSTVGIPTIGQPVGANDDGPTGATGSAFGPANPNHVSTGTRFQNSFTLPINMYREVSCVHSECIVPGTRVFVYLQIFCGTFFTGAGFTTANSCHFWGTGSNGWDLGNATIGAGRLQIFA
jgi:hypothetical protein